MGDQAWVVSDGKAGTENQCLGLAEAIGLPFTIKRLHTRTPWRWLPVGVWIPAADAALSTLVDGRADQLEAPWPRLVVAGGRQSIGVALALRRRGAFVVQVQNPRIAPRHFDLVVPPRHDHVTGPNVLSTRGAPHRVTPTRLAEAAARFRNLLAPLPRPLVAVLIGGNSVHYEMTEQDTLALTTRLQQVAREHGAGLAITASRRTGTTNTALLRNALRGDHTYFWDGEGENPYFGFLALADAIVVTADSVSMTSEAASTGKPVYVMPLSGGSAKLNEFHDRLRTDGVTRAFDGRLERWQYEPLDDTAMAAAEVRRRLDLAGATPD
ncbi:MAG: hypothetical protein FJX65_09030 [Alphaproteobacteria bacterium]|nr:hypothetical protein [Alphaproteobacteria bacterium]